MFVPIDWTCEQTRELDRRAVAEYGMASLVLMENAGRGVADVLCQLGISGKVLICCGKGNNAGDGLVIARHLDLRGFAVQIACWNDPQAWQGDVAANARIVRQAGIPLRPFGTERSAFREEIAAADWIVDALLGTGSVGSPRPPFDDVIDDINARTTARVLAVDLPSGLDADTGIPHVPTVRADCTCTFVARKTGFSQPEAIEYLGEVRVLDIGVPRKLMEAIAGQRPA